METRRWFVSYVRESFKYKKDRRCNAIVFEHPVLAVRRWNQGAKGHEEGHEFYLVFYKELDAEECALLEQAGINLDTFDW